MSDKVDQERRELAYEAIVERAKQVLRDLQRVATMTYEDTPLHEQARRLGVSRNLVYHYQRVLGLRASKPPAWLRGRLWGEKPD